MASKSKDLTNIDFDNDWKCYCQLSSDETNETTIVSSADTDQRWSSIGLPHMIDTVKHKQEPYTWWYRKQFDWSAVDPPSQQQVFLRFEPLDRHDRHMNIDATVWLDGIHIFSGLLSSCQDPIELSSKLLHDENKDGNRLTICCVNTNLSLHVCLLVDAKVIRASGQVISNERNLNKQQEHSDRKPNNVLDYTVSANDADGRIDVVFTPKRKTKATSATPWSLIEHSSPPVIDEQQTNGNVDEDLLIPRLAIVILIVGTRGDVQPFIALGQALRRAGHRVRLASHETFRSFVRDNGLEFYPLAGEPADLMSFMVKNAGIIPSISSIIEGDIRKKRRCLVDILASTWLACIADDDETEAPFTAEAIIANPPSFGHIHCAEKLQIPLHIMFTMPWSPTVAFPHPLANIDNSIGPKEKINLYSYDVIEMLTWTGMHDIVNNFRTKTLGLKELHIRQAMNVLIDERIPHTYCWSPSLATKPRDWGTHIDVSGYFFLNLGTVYTNPPNNLLEFLGINNDGSYNRRRLPPPIYIGFGSIIDHDSRRILGVVIEAIEQTGYRAVLSGFTYETDSLPSSIFRIGNVPHDWLFQHVSAVCHHGGAGTTAAGLRAGKPTIIVPFSGDQFFWGNVIEKSGAGPQALPGKSTTADQLAEAFRFVHQPTTCTAAIRIRDSILQEDGYAAAVYAFHANLPLTRIHSDLEPTFAACYRLDKYNLQISRPVAQVLVAVGALEESELRPHRTRDWQLEDDNRVHLPTDDVTEHSEKIISSMFADTAEDLKRTSNIGNVAIGTLAGVGSVDKGFGLGVGNLTIGCLSLYGVTTDTPNATTTLYDPYSDPKPRERPRVTDSSSNTKAIGVALYNGWKDGITGILRQSRAGYVRHDVLSSANEPITNSDEMAVKPTVSALKSNTWRSRGTYASVRKTVETYRSEGRRISSKLFDPSPSMEGNGHWQEDEDELFSTAVKTAAIRSGFHPKICQHILHEFEKIKKRTRTRTQYVDK